MLVKYCFQQVRHSSLGIKTAGQVEKKVLPLDNQKYRYLRFRAIGNLEVSGFNGNWDGFPYEEFENSEPGYGYKSFIGKRAHLEHNSALKNRGAIGDLPDAYLNRLILPEGIQSWSSIGSKDHTEKRFSILNMSGQRDGAIEVLMRLDLNRINNPSVDRDVRRKLAQLIQDIDSGKTLTCSMGTNCFVSGTQIYLPNGTFKRIEDVRRGDEILTHKGRSKKVTDLFIKHYEGDLIKISVRGIQRPLQLTPEHPVLVKKQASLCACGCGSRCSDSLATWVTGHRMRVFNANEKPKRSREEIEKAENELRQKYLEEFEWVEARDIEVTDLVVYPITHEEIETPHITEGKARLLGYFLAEGSYIKYTNKQGEEYLTGIEFAFGNTDKDKPFIEEVSRLIKEEFDKETHLYTITDPDKIEREKKLSKERDGTNFHFGSAELRVHSKEVANFFHYYCGEYAKSKGMPDEVMYWPKDLQKNLIGAYFNGDGCQSFEEGSTFAVTVSETLAYQISFLLKRVGVPNTLDRRHYEYQESPTYTVHVRGQSQNLLLDYWSYQERESRSSYRLTDNYILSPINRIDHDMFKGPVYNFEVEDDNSYVANGIVVHNCQKSRCSVCGNEAVYAVDYCNHLKSRKGSLHVVSANEIRDLLDRESLRAEWLKHIVASSFDVDEILKGISNKGIAVRAGEINQGLSFFELSVVKTPAYIEASALENLSKVASQDRQQYLYDIRKKIGDENILDLYELLKNDGLVSSLCSIR